MEAAKGVAAEVAARLAGMVARMAEAGLRVAMELPGVKMDRGPNDSRNRHNLILGRSSRIVNLHRHRRIGCRLDFSSSRCCKAKRRMRGRHL